jgi:hypothetical protein
MANLRFVVHVLLSIWSSVYFEQYQQAPINSCSQYAPFCGKCLNAQLICTNFTSFDQLDFADNVDLKKVFDKVVIKPLSPLALDNKLNLTGLLISRSAEVQLINIKQFQYDYNPLKALQVNDLKFNTLVIDNSTFDFLYENVTLMCDERLPGVASSKFGGTVFTNAHNIELKNGQFTGPICPYIFEKMSAFNMKIISPSTNFHLEQLNESIRVDMKINYFSIINANVENLDGFNRYFLSQTQKLYIDNTNISLIRNDTFGSLKALREVNLVNLDFGRLLRHTGVDWIRSLNTNVTVRLNNRPEIISNLRKSNYVKLVLRQTAYDFSNEDFCLLQSRYPLDKLVLFLVDMKQTTTTECTATLLWLMQIQKYYSYIPGNDFDLALPTSIQNCVNTCHCDFDKAIRLCNIGNASQSTFNVVCGDSNHTKTSESDLTTQHTSTFIQPVPVTNSSSTIQTSSAAQSDKCPVKCTCKVIGGLVELLCDRFESFDELQMTDTGLVYDSIVLRPSVGVDFNETLDLSRLQLAHNLTLRLSNILSFSVSHRPFKANRQLISKLIIENSKLSFEHNGKTLGPTNCDENTEMDDGVFQGITDTIQLIDTVFDGQICPLVFRNVRLSSLDIKMGSTNGLEFNTVEMHKPLNCLIQKVTIENVHLAVLDDLVSLNQNVFAKSTTILFRNSRIRRIANQAFRHFEQLKYLGFHSVNGESLFKTDINWLRSLNPLIQQLDPSDSVAIETKIKNKEFLTLDLRDIGYTFPDDDFCLFEKFPFERLIYMDVETVECTCTLHWLSKYNRFYSATGNMQCMENDKSECDFDGKLRKCVAQSSHSKNFVIVLAGSLFGSLVFIAFGLLVLIYIYKKRNSKYTSLNEVEVKMDSIQTSDELKKAR